MTTINKKRKKKAEEKSRLLRDLDLLLKVRHKLEPSVMFSK